MILKKLIIHVLIVFAKAVQSLDTVGLVTECLLKLIKESYTHDFDHPSLNGSSASRVQEI